MNQIFVYLVTGIVCATIYRSSSVIAYSSSRCSVYPSEIVTVVGGTVTLTCKTSGETVINSWKRNDKLGFEIYRASVTQSNKTIPEKLAAGYSVAWKSENELTLYFNETNFSHAGSYVCGCSDWSSSANVAVIASVPEFNKEGDITCSIKFNGSVRASFELEIKDCSDSILVSSSNLPLSFNRSNYTVSTVKNFNETLGCSVKLINDSSKVVLYSKDVKYSTRCSNTPEVKPPATDTLKVKPPATGLVPKSTDSRGASIGMGFGIGFIVAILLISAVLLLLFRLGYLHFRRNRVEIGGAGVQKFI